MVLSLEVHIEGEACAVWAGLKAQVDFPLSELSVVVVGLFACVEDVPDVEANPCYHTGDGTHFACGTQSVKRVAFGFFVLPVLGFGYAEYAVTIAAEVGFVVISNCEFSGFVECISRAKCTTGLDPFRWVPYLLGERRSTMPPTRPPYPPEFKKQMVELVRAGRTPGELAKEFEPSDQTIRNWVVQADRDEGLREDGLTSDEREELRRLRREIKQLRIEREILSKAAAWFAQETNTIPRKPSSS